MRQRMARLHLTEPKKQQGTQLELQDKEESRYVFLLYNRRRLNRNTMALETNHDSLDQAKTTATCLLIVAARKAQQKPAFRIAFTNGIGHAILRLSIFRVDSVAIRNCDAICGRQGIGGALVISQSPPFQAKPNQGGNQIHENRVGCHVNIGQSVGRGSLLQPPH